MIDLKDLILNNVSRRNIVEDSQGIFDNSKKIYCHVYRNHSFELIESTINAFLAHANLSASFSYSGYDDSFSFEEKNEKADIILLWIDLKKYINANKITQFLAERILHLKGITNKPIILVAIGPKNDKLAPPNILCVDISKIENLLAQDFYDERMESLSGTRLSGKALMEISKLLGLKYIPYIVNPTIKAIVVDLDNTLYSGVLGEDGIQNLELTIGHRLLQEKIKKLGTEGYILAIASKNDERDVISLFQQRNDFPLRINDFIKVYASWDSKSQMIKELAGFINIGPEAILFIDDNIGEILDVTSNIPSIKTLVAEKDGSVTARILDYYPGLTKISFQKEDIIRKEDILANEKRRSIQKTLSSEEYLESLKIVLQFKVNAAEEEKRIFELSNKTNQFIFTYKRYKLEEVSDIIKKEEYCVVTISLKDILTDSGIIGVCVGKKEANYVAIEEIFISCRALGRGIEETIIKSAIKIITEELKETRILIKFIKGERNIPAENFVNQFFSQFIFNPSEFEYTLPKKGVKIVKG